MAVQVRYRITKNGHLWELIEVRRGPDYVTEQWIASSSLWVNCMWWVTGDEVYDRGLGRSLH